MFNIINDDKKHQFVINNEKLLSTEILLKKEDALEILLLASNNNNDSVCALMSETELKKYNVLLTLPCLGNFKLPGADKNTNNYLVNNFFLFLNKMLKIEDDKVLLNHHELKMIYKRICFLVANAENKSMKNQLDIMVKMVDKININVKNQYPVYDVFNIPNAVEFIHQEGLIINPINLSCVISNAKENSNLFKNLGIKIEKQKEKTKA